jgi:hypothetical protein
MQEDVLEIEPVLDVPGPVEAESTAHRIDRLGGDAWVLRHLVQKITGRQLEQQEGQCRDSEQERDDLEQSPRDVRPHVAWTGRT